VPPLTGEEVIKTVGAVGVAVATYWFGLAAAIAPPDPDSMAFLSIACAVAGLILGGAMIVFRSRIDGRWIVGLILLATLVGGGALFRYEHHRAERTVQVRDVGETTTLTVVTDVLTPPGLAAVIDTEVCSADEVVSRARRQVTFACARRAADEISAADYMFNAEERRRSSGILIGWYRLAAACLMLALFLLVDFFLAKVPPRATAPAGPANGPPDPH
jgi:hypothetical protein